MQKYFKRIAEYVKAFQYNGETREELPQWVQSLECQKSGIDFALNAYGTYIMFNYQRVENTNWLVVFEDREEVITDEEFRRMFEVDDMEDLA